MPNLKVFFIAIYFAWPRSCFYQYSFVPWDNSIETECDDAVYRSYRFWMFFFLETLQLIQSGVIHLVTAYYLATYFVMTEFWTKKICKEFLKTDFLRIAGPAPSINIIQAYRSLK